jgi:predicted RNA-binding protein Jag
MRPQPETRVRDDETGGYKVIQAASQSPLREKKGRESKGNGRTKGNNSHSADFSYQPWGLPQKRPIADKGRTARIFPYAVSRNRIEKAVEGMNVKAEVVRRFEDADVILTLKSQEHKGTKKLREMAGNGVPIFTIRSNTVTQIQHFLREYFNLQNPAAKGRKVRGEMPADDYEGLSPAEMEQVAIQEAEEGSEEALRTSETVELRPKNSYLRRLQHQIVEKYNLKSVSLGKEPFRRVCIYMEPENK